MVALPGSRQAPAAEPQLSRCQLGTRPRLVACFVDVQVHQRSLVARERANAAARCLIHMKVAGETCVAGKSCLQARGGEAP